ncbi:MAG: site-specific DNA-methyltransferase [Planctomycetaceae bacterium]|nr:site-specific DNA-methyltransferase [Planctomycetaceae bacterium]
MSLQKNEIHQGDCIELLARLDEGSVDLAFADPPFNIGYEYDVYDDSRKAEDYLNWSQQWISGVYRALKPDGTFWLAIGDEYAAELKLEAQKVGFHCRSWVIWYYTFGVNCVNGFSRSHTHLFHFIKDPKRFTFHRQGPEVRVKSARELVYADNRANPNGRLPDNTWITRPQDAPEFLSFNPNHDTWYFARVAGTFKEREGFHGCQMPEQLLARIIRVSSRPQELVLDPFGGSGTTLCAAKKLARDWIGFELSEDYVRYIHQRLEGTLIGDPIDGPEDPILSAPSTAKGKRRKKPFSDATEQTVVKAFLKSGQGASVDYVLCDPELNKEFISLCLKEKLGGSAHIWNRYLLELQRIGKLPEVSSRQQKTDPETAEILHSAAEAAWRLLEIDYRRTLDDILCSPEFATEFDRLAAGFAPDGLAAQSLDYRLAALDVRNSARQAADAASAQRAAGRDGCELSNYRLDDLSEIPDGPGVFVLFAGKTALYAGESENVRRHAEQLLQVKCWRRFAPDSVSVVECRGTRADRYIQKTMVAQQVLPVLNCRLPVHVTEPFRGSSAETDGSVQEQQTGKRKTGKQGASRQRTTKQGTGSAADSQVQFEWSS